MNDQQSQLQVNAGFTGAELNMLHQGLEKVAAECHVFTNVLSFQNNTSLDPNTVTLLDYYGKRLKAIHQLQRRVIDMQVELEHKTKTNPGEIT